MGHEALAAKDHKTIAQYADWKGLKVQLSAPPTIVFRDEHGEEVRRTIKEMTAELAAKDANR